MDRFDAMQAFARVVETGSFTKAAETLNISRTSVTQLVQQLEARLRVKLLNRTTRKVNVTADGAVYYERVLQLLADLDDAETSLSAALASPRGRLRVDVSSPFASKILIPALPQFHARYPDIELHLGVSDRVVDLIDENVDCVIRGGEIANQSLVARHVADLPLGLYAAPAYLAESGVPVHPRELQGDELVLGLNHAVVAGLRVGLAQFAHGLGHGLVELVVVQAADAAQRNETPLLVPAVRNREVLHVEGGEEVTLGVVRGGGVDSGSCGHRLAHRSFHLQFNQFVQFECVFHWQVTRNGFYEATNDHCHRFFF